MSPEIRFDGWTLRTDSGELTREGSVTRLQEQPLLVLIELLSRPGELVTREQLISRLWPKGVVDFETGLNTVVRKLRVASRRSGPPLRSSRRRPHRRRHRRRRCPSPRSPARNARQGV